MTGEANDWLNTLHSAPVGPTTTLARNFALVVAAVVGLFFMLIPSIQGVPVPNRIVPALGGAALVAIAVIGFRRWKALVRGMAREATRMGGIPLFAFMNKEVERGGPTSAQNSGGGWVILDEALLTISPRTALGMRPQEQTAVISTSEIVSASLLESTASTFNRLELELTNGEAWRFTVVPFNGSGGRGATADEVRSVISLIDQARGVSG